MRNASLIFFSTAPTRRSKRSKKPTTDVRSSPIFRFLVLSLHLFLFLLVYQRDLVKDIEGGTHRHLKHLLLAICEGKRDESSLTDPVSASTDAQALYDAGEGKFFTDKSKFTEILATRSYPQIRRIFEEYQKISKKNLTDAVEKELTGWTKEGMRGIGTDFSSLISFFLFSLYSTLQKPIVQCAYDPPEFYSERLQKSMKGLTTNDEALIRLVMDHCEDDLEEIKTAFLSKCKKPLHQMIENDTSGDYRKLMVQVVGA